MSDETGVCNLALGRIGVGQAIAALTDRTVPAETCNRFFAQCRQEVLRAFPWDFAQRAEPLALVADQTFPGWNYVYQYPSGCLGVRSITDETGLRAWRSWRSYPICDAYSWPALRPWRQPWKRALKDDGASQVILTDVPAAWALFTADVTNMGVWPVDAQSVFAWRLAMEIGGPLSAKRELIDAAETRYNVWFSQATATALNEARDEQANESVSITCRA